MLPGNFKVKHINQKYMCGSGNIEKKKIGLVINRSVLFFNG